jgi:hypothetical protein
MTKLETSYIIEQNKIFVCFENQKNINKKLIKRLDDMLLEFHKSEKKRIGLKSLGVAASTVGAIGLVGAPFTAGLSLPLTIVGGIGAGTGVISNVSTEIWDIIESKKIIDKLIEVAECRKNDMEVEDKIVFELIQYVDEIINQENLTFEQAISKAMKDHTEGEIRFRKFLKNEDVNNVMEDLLTEEETDQLLDDLPSDPNSGFLIVPDKSLFERTSEILKPSSPNKFRSASRMLLKATETTGATVANVLARQVAVTTFRQVAKVAAINLAIFSLGFELILLFRDWKRVHPTMEKILAIKKKLEEEIVEYDRKIERVRTLAAKGNSYKMKLLELSVEKLETEKAKCDHKVAVLEQENNYLKEDIEKIKKVLNKLNIDDL